MLNNGGLRVRIVLCMAQSVALKQIGAGKGFGADMALVRLFLRVHTDMARQMVQPSVALGTFAAAVQPLTGRDAIIEAVIDAGDDAGTAAFFFFNNTTTTSITTTTATTTTATTRTGENQFGSAPFRRRLTGRALVGRLGSCSSSVVGSGRSSGSGSGNIRSSRRVWVHIAPTNNVKCHDRVGGTGMVVVREVGADVSPRPFLHTSVTLSPLSKNLSLS